MIMFPWSETKAYIKKYQAIRNLGTKLRILLISDLTLKNSNLKLSSNNYMWDSHNPTHALLASDEITPASGLDKAIVNPSFW